MFNYDNLKRMQKMEPKAAVPDANSSGATASPWSFKGQFDPQMLGQIAAFGSQILGTPRGYEGKYGTTTQTIDGLSDSAADVLAQYNPAMGAIAKAGLFAGKALNKLGGGTDGMTKSDAFFNSSLGQLTGIGFVNGLIGKKADTLNVDHYTQSQSQFSYGGTNYGFNEALQKSGKKYGVFSNRARKAANAEIAAAGRTQNQLKYIIKDRDMAMESMGNTTDIYNTGYMNELMGGYQPVYAAKSGIKFPSKKAVQKAKRVVSKHKFTKLKEATDAYKNGGVFEFDVSMFQKGGKSRKYTFEQYMNIRKPSDKEKEWYDYEGFYNDDELYPEWEERYEKWLNTPNRREEDFPHSTDKYKTEKHPTYSDKNYGWVGSDEEGWKFYVSPRQRANMSFAEYIDYWKWAEPKDLLIYSPTQTYKVGDTFTEAKEFKKGGKLDPNIIPEGALHARKHHLEEENPELKGKITTKGIPVVSEEEGGELIQHAEVEKEEITLSKEVTEQIEEYYKQYKEKPSDDIAIKCGKFLAKQIMENTIDKVGLLSREI